MFGQAVLLKEGGFIINRTVVIMELRYLAGIKQEDLSAETELKLDRYLEYQNRFQAFTHSLYRCVPTAHP